MKTETKKKFDNFDIHKFHKDFEESVKKGKPMEVMAPLFKMLLEATLEGELDNYLNCEEEENNRRNGKTRKMVKSPAGSFELVVPRDRESSFEPQIVRKRQTEIGDIFGEKIIALYGLGMSYQAINQHLREMYETEIDESTMTAITDRVIPKLREWQARPLNEVYPIIWMDAIHFKVKDNGRAESKAVYIVLGISEAGLKEVLGIYLGESEGANFWLSVLTDLKNRGVKDILIASVDGLKGFPTAIESIFPKTEIQLCIVHQIRNSLKYIVSKDQKSFLKDLKEVYKAANKEYAEQKLLELEEKWGKKYPVVLKSWISNWERLSQYFKYPEEIRKMIYTTNPIESLNRQIRKITKTKGMFSSPLGLEKLLYLAIQNISKKWTAPLQNWAMTISQLAIFFEGRLTIKLSS